MSLDTPHAPAETSSPVSSAELCLWGFLATVAMLFAAFFSAYLVRRTGTDWSPIRLPPILWLNTGVLVLSSVLLKTAGTSLKHGRRNLSANLLAASTLLGAAFLAGQFLAWRELANEGCFLSSNPHGSFFYVLTGLHGVHLATGLLFLAYAAIQARRHRAGAPSRRLMTCVSTYWHFMAVLWGCILVLLIAY